MNNQDKDNCSDDNENNEHGGVENNGNGEKDIYHKNNEINANGGKLSKDSLDFIPLKVINVQDEEIKVASSEEYYRVFLAFLMAENIKIRENKHYWVLALNSEGYIVCVYIFALNPKDLMNISIKFIFRVATMLEATKIVFAYNVTNENDLMPKGVDFDFFNKVYNHSLNMDIEVVDMMVISRYGYHSDKDDGYLEYYRDDISFKFVYNVREKIKQEKEQYAKKEADKASRKSKMKERRKMARIMLDQGEDFDKIMKYTCLTRWELEDLQGGK